MTLILEIKTEPKLIKRGQGYFWKLIKAQGKGNSFTRRDICDQCSGVIKGTVNDYLKRLTLGGFLTSEIVDGTTVYTLEKVQSSTPTLRRDGTATVNGQQFIWNAIRQLRTFTLAELRVAATTEEYRPTLATVKSYVARLNGSNYFTMREKKAGGTTYTLKPSMDTGPDAPRILRTKAIYDPNTSLMTGEAETVEGGAK